MAYIFDATVDAGTANAFPIGLTAAQLAAEIGAIILAELPTTDPVEAGALYAVDGILFVSEGA